MSTTIEAIASANRSSADNLVDARTLKEWIDAGRATVVDVRDPEEFAREHISGARLVPLSRFEPGAIPEATTVVLHCKSGRRSAEAAARLAATGRAGILQLKGGLDAWKAAGLPVEENRRVPISIMRQVQLAVGVSLLVLSALSAFVSPWFLGLIAFFGAGLAFAGATGMCGLAAVLGAMPWNKAFRSMPREAALQTPCCSGGKCG